MSRPTEPGHYWLNVGAWHIVEVVKSQDELLYYYTGGDPAFAVGHTHDGQWGGRITQQPVTDPPF